MSRYSRRPNLMAAMLGSMLLNWKALYRLYHRKMLLCCEENKAYKLPIKDFKGRQLKFCCWTVCSGIPYLVIAFQPSWLLLPSPYIDDHKKRILRFRLCFGLFLFCPNSSSIDLYSSSGSDRISGLGTWVQTEDAVGYVRASSQHY